MNGWTVVDDWIDVIISTDDPTHGWSWQWFPDGAVEAAYRITLVDLAPEIPVCGARRDSYLSHAFCIAPPGHESPHVACSDEIEAECHPRVVNIQAVRSPS